MYDLLQLSELGPSVKKGREIKALLFHWTAAYATCSVKKNLHSANP